MSLYEADQRYILLRLPKDEYESTHSAGAFRKYQSIAPENAANAAPPPIIALGPEYRAKTAPAKKPADTALVISFFARY